MERQNQNQTLEFRTIVLNQIQRILEISSKELKDGTKTVFRQNQTDIVNEEDTRVSYIQAIENLAIILLPYFDSKVKSVFESSTKLIHSFDYELEENFKDEINKIEKAIAKKPNLSILFMTKKLESARVLFIELNLLLKRQDYLRSTVYGEDKDEVVKDD